MRGALPIVIALATMAPEHALAAGSTGGTPNGPFTAALVPVADAFDSIGNVLGVLMKVATGLAYVDGALGVVLESMPIARRVRPHAVITGLVFGIGGTDAAIAGFWLGVCPRDRRCVAIGSTLIVLAAADIALAITGLCMPRNRAPVLINPVVMLDRRGGPAPGVAVRILGF